jgi:tRNA(fMet)-specific endonuclease VapC
MYLLDTNTLTELFKNNSAIVEHIQELPDDSQVATTIVSQIELLQGRFAFLLKASSREELLRATALLRQDDANLSDLEIVPVTDDTARLFEQFLTNKKLKKIGRPDLLIACIALANKATLVTRNTKDFAGIANLKLENWFV